MTIRRLIGCALALGVCTPMGLLAQSRADSLRSAKGGCALWSDVPGGSSMPGDATYNRCALDRAPVLRAGQPMPPPPWYGSYAGGSFQVIVNADGRVDPGLTRAWTRGMDTASHNRALETIRRWRFAPGIRRGKPVRSGFTLELRSNGRVDTLPASFAWSYRQGGGRAADTLVGTWSAEAPLPPFTPERLDSVYVALLRRLVRMQVVIPGRERPYCLVPAQGDSADQARLSRLAGRVVYPLAPPGCERTPSARRVVLPRVYRTENGRAVLFPSGDDLKHWPRGGRPAAKTSRQQVSSVSTLTSKKAGNWVDRGEPPEPTLRRILAFYFGKRDPADEPWLSAHAAAVRGMVEADATEVHVAGYLRGVWRDLGAPAPPGGRVTAIALWHAAKAALVRDFAERVLRGEVPRPEPTPEPLARWLAARLLTPAELEAFERGDAAPQGGSGDEA